MSFAFKSFAFAAPHPPSVRTLSLLLLEPLSKITQLSPLVRLLDVRVCAHTCEVMMLTLCCCCLVLLDGWLGDSDSDDDVELLLNSYFGRKIKNWLFLD
jgi:hypothetical protein